MNLEGLARSWRNKLLTRQVFLAIAVAAAGHLGLSLVGAISWRWGAAFFILALLGQMLRNRFWSISAADVASHLNRVLPVFQESVQLLLAAPESLTLLGKLQRERIVGHWRENSSAVRTANPIRLRTPVALAVLLGLLCLFVPRSRILPSARIDSEIVSAKSPTTLANNALICRAATVEIEPPSYLQLPVRKTADLNIQAEEGSLLQWNLHFEDSPDAAVLVFGESERLPLVAQADGSFVGAKAVGRSAIYTIEARVRGEVRQMDSLFAIRMVPDLEPKVTLLSPVGRSEIDGLAQPLLPIRVRGTDDHGISDVWLVATVASGGGENVRFRERRLPLALAQENPGDGTNFKAILDLANLGMIAGDELYFHAEATDNRQPLPQMGRSDTAFVQWPGAENETIKMSKGVMVSRLFAVFRSQRQIIIDTEKLLSTTSTLTRPVFLDRSDEIGVDQKLLRLRYGQFLGEESETADQRGRIAAPSLTDGSAAEVVETFGHVHDVQDTASLFDRETKSGLEQALAQMWDAERNLRVGELEKALPFEKEALRILKALDVNARVYVQKSGFEAPPLHEKQDRLTGVVAATDREPVRKTFSVKDDWQAVRQLLALVSGEGQLTAQISAALEVARVALAEPALADDAKYLPVLREIRLLQTGAESANVKDRLRRLEADLWKILPTPAAEPSAKTTPESALTGDLRAQQAKMEER